MKKFFIFICIAGVWSSSFAEADLAAQVDDHFRVYLIQQERRSPGDRVIVKNDGKGQKAIIFYWENLAKRKPADAICDAYEWLMLGRTTYGKGAKEAFEKFPSLQAIEVSFYDIDFSTKKGTKRAEILPNQKLIEYLKVGVQRDSLMKKSIDKKDIRDWIEKKQCTEIGKKYGDTVMINNDYMDQHK